MWQYDLVEYLGASRLVCWIDGIKLKSGTKLTLEEIPNTVWVVHKVYDIPLASSEIRRGWKVGGLK